MHTAIAHANPRRAHSVPCLRCLAIVVYTAGAAAGALAADAEALRLNPMTPYERSMKQQELNSAKQQDAGRAQQQQDQLYQDAQQQAQRNAAAATAQGQAVLRTWQSRPPLAADKNPLLGRWTSQIASPANAKKLTAANPMASLLGPEFAKMASSLVGGMTAGLCDSMLGSGLVEFRPNAVVAIGRDGRERTMYRAEYRGSGSRVAVLPQAGQSFTHMIVDLDSRDHATVAGVGCVLTRGGSSADAADAAEAGPGVARAAPATTAPSAVLALDVGLAQPLGGVTPDAGRDVLVLKEPAEVALASAGIRASPSGGAVFNFLAACERREPQCLAGARALGAHSANHVKTDAGGHARTAALPAGRYYVFGTFSVDNRKMMWNVPVDLRGAPMTLTLNQHNGMPVR